jgi:hypothetical protein
MNDEDLVTEIANAHFPATRDIDYSPWGARDLAKVALREMITRFRSEESAVKALADAEAKGRKAAFIESARILNDKADHSEGVRWAQSFKKLAKQFLLLAEK